MSENSEKGSVIIFSIFIFLIIGLIAVFVVTKTLTKSTQKLAKTQEIVAVAIKSEYQNPFDENTQYSNPFNDYQNPFDDIK